MKPNQNYIVTVKNSIIAHQGIGHNVSWLIHRGNYVDGNSTRHGRKGGTRKVRRKQNHRQNGTARLRRELHVE